MRAFLLGVLACLLIATPAGAQTTISIGAPGGALVATAGNNGGGVSVIPGGLVGGTKWFSHPRGQIADNQIGRFQDGKPCEAGSGAVNCLAPPSSVTFTGGNGNDTVSISSGTASAVNVTALSMGAGSDYVWIGGHGARTNIDGGDGNDYIQPRFTFEGGSGDWTIDLASGTANSNNGNATSFLFSNFESVDLDTSRGVPSGKYTIYGDEGPNTIWGGSGGEQRYYGRGGNDQIYAGGNDPVFIDGGPGNDTISGGPKDDVLTGGPGADRFSCGAGVDIVTDFNPAEGDTIAADCEQFFPAPFDIVREGRGAYKFQSRIETTPDRQPLVLKWDFGNGKTAGDITVTGSTYDKPGTYQIVHTATDFKGSPYRTSKPLVLPAPELAVSVSLDEGQLVGNRLPLNEWVNARVRVASTGDDAVGDLSDLRFTDSVLKASGLAPEQLDIELLEAAPGAFSLAPGASREFALRLRAKARGTLSLSSTVTGKDAAGGTVSGTGTRGVQAGLDLEVTVTAAPAEVDLEVDSTATPPRPIKKPLTLTVAIRNVSGQRATNVVLDLLPAIRDATNYNPSAPFPLQLVKKHGNPEVPLTNATARDIPIVASLSAGSTTTATFTADAANKSIVDVRAIARAVAVEPNRDIVGNGTAAVRIGQPKLIALTTETPGHAGLIRAGSRWSYSGHVENLSPNRAITVFVFAKRHENVIDGQLSSILAPGECTCGVYKRLEPGERIPIHASLGSTPDGGTRARIEIGIIGEVHEPGGDVALAQNAIVVAPGADVREASIDLSDPVNDPFSLSEAGWIMTDSAARAFGARVQGAYASAAAAMIAAQTFVETPKSLYLQQTIAFIHEEVPEAVARTRAEVALTLQELLKLSSAEALAVTDQALTTGMIKTSEAWDDATWQDMAQTTGTLLGSLAPDIALELAMPALAACKLLKYGGKTAMLRKAQKLGDTRAGRLLARGMEGLVPGDVISSLLARKLWGIDGLIDAQLIAYAKAKKVVIAVRERSPGSIRRLAEGMLPKWEKIKAKNVSELDVEFLGFHTNHLDTAMLKQMPEWSAVEAKLAGKSADVRGKVRARWEQRKQEWEGKDLAAMRQYADAGKIPKPSKKYGVNPTENGLPAADGVWTDAEFELTSAGSGGVDRTTDGLPAYQPRVKENGRLRAMTGDMDPIAVLDENGQILDLERRLEVYRDMAKMGFQHPESLTWDNAAERAKYLFDFDLANGKGRALLAYGPDGTRRAAYFDSRKSRLAEGLMVLVGTDMVFETTKVVAGDVPVIEPPEARVEPAYITPGGEAGANLSRSPDARLIRRNLDGSMEEWTPEGGWRPYTLPGGATVTTLPQTSVRTAVAAGETRIDINEADALILLPGAQAWFEPGDFVVLDPGGPNEEYVRVAALGSIITTAPLEQAHRVGEMVALVPAKPAVVTPPVVTPAPSGPEATPTPAPKALPRVLSAKLAKTTFKRKQGTRLTLVLSEPATVTVALTRAVSGRKVGKKCKAGGKKGRKCTLQVAAGKVTVKPAKGTKVTVAFGKGLRAGRYTATLRAAGGAPTTVRFTVR